MLFCVTDIETTGGRLTLNGMTEIASVLTDGTEIIDTFQTLLKPDESIPAFITNLTGIHNEMVENAPTFEEIADKWIEFSKDAVFVAHNVGFDYGHISQQLASINVEYKPKRLCTVRLSRKIAKGLNSYSLGNLCSSLKIPITNRHRAMGDAMATAHLLHYLIANDGNGVIETHLKKQQKTFALPPYLEEKEYENLPMKTGVYYLLNKERKPLYIGKAKNIKQRVRSHFRTAKKQLLDQLYHLDFKLTGTDLLASVIEADEIKQYWPPFNVAQKFPRNTFTVTQYINQKDELKLAIKRSKKSELSPLFGSQYSTRVYLESWIEENKLCPRLGGLQLECEEKCVCKVDKKHLARFKKTIIEMQEYLPSFCLVDKGRNEREKSMLWVKKGKMMGYLFQDQLPSTKEKVLENAITPLKEHPETASIIGKYLAEYMLSNSKEKQYIKL